MPVIAYAREKLPPFDAAFYDAARRDMAKAADLTVPPRDGRVFRLAKGQLYRILCKEGPQVSKLNLWNALKAESVQAELRLVVTGLACPGPDPGIR